MLHLSKPFPPEKWYLQIYMHTILPLFLLIGPGLGSDADWRDGPGLNPKRRGAIQQPILAQKSYPYLIVFFILEICMLNYYCFQQIKLDLIFFKRWMTGFIHFYVNVYGLL